MKALVLSGGGSRGAFQVGAIRRLMVTEGHRYDIFCGTSVGSLNAAMLAQYDHASQLDGLGALTTVWKNIKQSDVYKGWPILGMALGIFKKGLYNASPLKNLIKKHIDPTKFKSKLRVAAASLDTGSLRVFTEQDSNILDGVYASSAFPVMFEPIKIENNWYTDGGVRDLTPLRQAIQAGATEIHIINCSNIAMGQQDADDFKSLSVLLRSVDIMSNEILLNDLETMININELVKNGLTSEKRYIKYKLLQPHPLTRLSDSLTFNHEEILDMIESGMWDTFEHISNESIVIQAKADQNNFGC
jgi:NTE family protein